MMRTFRSDNNAGICPEAMAGLVMANDASHAMGYSDDAITAGAVDAFRDIFSRDTFVQFVATGTAANTLALAALTEPWQQVLAHAHSHINADESTAPERFTHCRVTGIHTHEADTITPEDFRAAATDSRGDVHQPQPGVFSISNATEFGCVYSPAEVKTLAEAAHAAGYRVHMDGARFANAVAALGCDPRELTVGAGVDALSFGGTKNGLAFGEAILLFPQGDGRAFERASQSLAFHRKGTGHLLSKHRFVSGMFLRTLEQGAWLRHAAHANAMARRLEAGLTARGLKPRFPVQANAVFVTLPGPIDDHLRACGHGYYPFGDRRWNVVRLMCSWDTTESDIDGLLRDIDAAMRM